MITPYSYVWKIDRLLQGVNTQLYGHSMTDRLSADIWLRHGLKTLAEQGPSALKAEPLARTLGVSRGSFYWHFSNVEDFCQQVLTAWQQAATREVIVRLESQTNAADKLVALMKQAFSADPGLERAIRAWAVQYPPAAECVKAVDEERTLFLQQLLPGDDHNAKHARFIYWAYLGRMLTDDQRQESFTEADIRRIVDLFQA